MIGILIIAHGTLGESLIHCASHVLNKRPSHLKQLGITAQDDPALLLPQARKMVKALDDSDGVLILTDMYGATPTNAAISFLLSLPSSGNSASSVTALTAPMPGTLRRRFSFSRQTGLS